MYAGRAEDSGLRVIDVADPAAPRVVSVHATVGPVRQLAVSGVRLLALAAEALYVFDITKSSWPREIGHVDVRIPGPDVHRWPTGTLGLEVLNEVADVGASGAECRPGGERGRRTCGDRRRRCHRRAEPRRRGWYGIVGR